MATWRPTKALTLVEGVEFGNTCDQLDPGRQVLDRALEGVSWAIARNADYFPRIPGTVLFVAQVTETSQLPALLILFRHLDADRCELVTILEDPDG